MLHQVQQQKKAHALELFRGGCTWAEAASGTGVNRTTLWRWSQVDPDFASAITEAKADPDIEVEAVTFQQACDPDPANNTLRMFWLKSRKPRTYIDRQDITSDGKAIGSGLSTGMEKALESFGYVKADRAGVGETEPSPLRGAGECGPVEVSGSASPPTIEPGLT